MNSLAVLQAREAWSVLWPYGLSLFLTYTVTLTIFPGFLAEDVHSDLLKDWYPLLIITCYNAGDMLGKVIAPTQTKSTSGTASSSDHAHQYQPVLSTPADAAAPALPVSFSSQIIHGEHHDQASDGGNSGLTMIPTYGSSAVAISVDARHQLGSPNHATQTHSGNTHRGPKLPISLLIKSIQDPMALFLHSPMALVAAAAMRGFKLLLLFIIAAHHSAPAWIILPATAVLGVSNG